MGIFSAILDKLRHHGSAAQGQGGQINVPGAQSGAAAQASTAGKASASPMPTGGSAQSASTAQAALHNVDVDAVLSQLAGQKGGGGNYRQSIVDLLKLLDLDSSLNARKELASELGVHAGADGSAEQNIALHKAVMRKVAENGGKVPESMRN